MGIRIALAGNPNCGKTTMFNDLTGANQYVGNWPGVTVEKKEGKTTMYPLTDFQIRQELDIKKGYINGRFGAIPFLGDLDNLNWKY